jgi:hypothetical protein
MRRVLGIAAALAGVAVLVLWEAMRVDWGDWAEPQMVDFRELR